MANKKEFNFDQEGAAGLKLSNSPGQDGWMIRFSSHLVRLSEGEFDSFNPAGLLRNSDRDALLIEIKFFLICHLLFLQ